MIAALSQRFLQPQLPISARSRSSRAIPHLNNVFSSVCGLLRTFGTRNPLFSANYRLFCQKQGGIGGGARGIEQAPITDNQTATRLSSTHWGTMRSQRSRAHTKSRRQRWWDIPQKISAAGTAPFMRGNRRGIRAQPMASRFAQLVDALNRESRQILHHSSRNCVALKPVHRVSITNSCLTELRENIF